MDGTRKFKNFWLSTFAVQRLSNLICLEHQLSTIEYKPYREWQKRIVYPPKESNRDRLCGIIEEITLHKAAKAAFDEAGLQKLPKIKELDAEFAELLTKKKAAYPDYRKARNEMQELVRAQKNVERFFAKEKDTIEKAQTR